MDFPFDVQRLLGGGKLAILTSAGVLVSTGGRGGAATRDAMASVIDAMGRASAKAQGLQQVITTLSKLIAMSEQTLYIACSRNCVYGIVKDASGAVAEIDPLCVLDFYVHETRQRQGVGKWLFEQMLKHQNVVPNKCAYDRPSPKLLGFLAKHYHLRDYTPQPNNFVVFKAYWTGGVGGGGGARASAGRRASSGYGQRPSADPDLPEVLRDPEPEPVPLGESVDTVDFGVGGDNVGSSTASGAVVGPSDSGASTSAGGVVYGAVPSLKPAGAPLRPSDAPFVDRVVGTYGGFAGAAGGQVPPRSGDVRPYAGRREVESAGTGFAVGYDHRCSAVGSSRVITDAAADGGVGPFVGHRAAPVAERRGWTPEGPHRTAGGARVGTSRSGEPTSHFAQAESALSVDDVKPGAYPSRVTRGTLSATPIVVPPAAPPSTYSRESARIVTGFGSPPPYAVSTSIASAPVLDPMSSPGVMGKVQGRLGRGGERIVTASEPAVGAVSKPLTTAAADYGWHAKFPAHSTVVAAHGPSGMQLAARGGKPPAAAPSSSVPSSYWHSGSGRDGLKFLGPTTLDRPF